MSRSPPSYAVQPSMRSVGVLLLELFIPLCSLLLALDQLLILQPALYLDTSTQPSPTTQRVLLIGAACAGWFVAKRSSLSVASLVAALGVTASSILYFLAVPRGDLAKWLPTAAGIATLWCLGHFVRGLPRALVRLLSADGIRRVLLHPTLGALLLGLLSAAAVLSHAIGPLRSGLAIGGGLLAFAVLYAAEAARDNWSARDAKRASWRRWLGYGLFLCYSATAFWVELRLPLRRVLTNSHTLIAFAVSERCSFELSTGQGARHLFVDGELRLSTFDQRRWAESMVLPALARQRHAKHALVLSTGEGVLERELLKDEGLLSITSVVRCGLVPDFARQSAWMRQLNQNALNSRRVTLIERDPAAYLANTPPRIFDLLIVDLPDPAGPLQTKYYSRFFYHQLAERMHDASILVVQATSAHRSPRTFATIGATLRAAGLVVAPAIVPLISRGEWSLYLAAKQPLPEVVRERFVQGTLAQTTPEQFTQPWPDTLAPNDFTPEASTLYDARVLDWFEREAESSYGR